MTLNTRCCLATTGIGPTIGLRIAPVPPPVRILNSGGTANLRIFMTSTLVIPLVRIDSDVEKSIWSIFPTLPFRLGVLSGSVMGLVGSEPIRLSICSSSTASGVSSKMN